MSEPASGETPPVGDQHLDDPTEPTRAGSGKGPADAVGESADGPPPILDRRDPIRTALSRPIRLGVLAILSVLGAGAIALGTVNARNVTYNLFVDEGASNGIPRFSRERVIDIWQTMWANAPDFGSVDLVRVVLLIGGAVFLLAGLAVVFLAFVPSRAEWVNDLSSDQVDSQPGD